jgi:hypothetical protein
MGNHIFVSHSHEDSAAADLIVKGLEERGVTCWLAPRDVPPGGSYVEALLNAIESASCFVLIYSQHSNASSHVLREVERALKFGLNIVPVRFDDSTPSKSLDYLLATVHWLSVVSGSGDRSIGKAAEQIAACVTKVEGPRPTAEPVRVPPPTIVAPVSSKPTRYLFWIGAAIVLALTAAVIWLLASRTPPRTETTQKSSVVSSATTPLSTPAVMATTATATPQMDQSEMPVAVTHRYFALVNKRNATAAYNLLSSGFRQRLSIVKYSRNVGFTPPVKLADVIVVSKNERTASVTAVFEDTNAESHQPRWQGPIDFVLEPAGWRIDRMKGLFPASGRPNHNATNESDDETIQDSAQSAPASTAAPQATASPTPASAVHQAVHGVVQDPDGIANVRDQPLIRAKIVAVVKNGERVEIDAMQGDWVHIVLGPGKGGFIHKSRVRIEPQR